MICRVGPAVSNCKLQREAASVRTCLTNCLTIGANQPELVGTSTDSGTVRSAADAHLSSHVTWLRDEEVAGSNPVTPTNLGCLCPRRARALIGRHRFLGGDPQTPTVRAFSDPALVTLRRYQRRFVFGFCFQEPGPVVRPCQVRRVGHVLYGR
jgi:hypothetical protein